MYILLQRKNRRSYEEMLEMIVEQCRDRLQKSLKIDKIIIDFELAVCKAVQRIFPECQISFCHFHFCQAIYRRVQKLNLFTSFANDPTIYAQVRILMALAYLPPNDIDLVFSKLNDNASEMVKPLMEYMNKNFISSTARFKKDHWSVYELMVQELPRTSNNAESWHSRLNALLRCKHPGFLVIS